MRFFFQFSVQLSSDEDFLCLCGHYEVADTRQLKYHIKNLCQGQPYYIRVASGNIKGYSAYKLSTPAFIVPSSKDFFLSNFFMTHLRFNLIDTMALGRLARHFKKRFSVFGLFERCIRRYFHQCRHRSSLLEK